MRKIFSAVIILVLLLVAMASTATAAVSGLEDVVSAQMLKKAVISSEGQGFEGDWIVSGYQEGDALTARFDGTVVRIRKNGIVFLIDGPTNQEATARFHQTGNMLQGAYIPTLAQLSKTKEDYPTVPESVLKQAIAKGKLVYRINLTQGEDGQISVERDNIAVFFLRNIFTSNFDHVVQYPAWCKYTLIKKGV